MIKRAYIFAGVLIVGGATINMIPRPPVERKTEEWMQQHLPSSVGKYQFHPPTPGALESSRMPDSVYEILKPFGIVSRDFVAGNEQYEATVIASQSDDSFHDPRVCFSAQNWTLGAMDEVKIPTKSRGEIPATITVMTGPGGEKVAAFVYKGPGGFYATTAQLKWVMLYEQLKGNNQLDGVFYRFIAMHPSATKEKLMEFIGIYMDEASKISDGYF